jgi:hypothetical protein
MGPIIRINDIISYICVWLPVLMPLMIVSIESKSPNFVVVESLFPLFHASSLFHRCVGIVHICVVSNELCELCKDRSWKYPFVSTWLMSISVHSGPAGYHIDSRECKDGHVGLPRQKNVCLFTWRTKFLVALQGFGKAGSHTRHSFPGWELTIVDLEQVLLRNGMSHRVKVPKLS